MTKNIIIVVLLLLVKAKAYINDLESDFPEFIDTTSGGDTYSEYYDKIY